MRRYLSVFLMTVLVIGAFFLGRVTASPLEGNTFYATIVQKSGTHLVVEGLKENDANHRGWFQFDVEDVPLSWRYTAITTEDLDLGDRIAVTYTGQIMEISPAIISDVLKIQLLDDEK